MKKIILSIAALMVTSASFAQPFVNGSSTFTESFGATGTSCLKAYVNGGYQYPDGNVATQVNDANAITITAKSTLSPGVATSLSDVYYLNGTNCVPMRPDNVGVDMTGNAKISVVVKSSVAGATIQFHVASAPNTYPGATTASLLVPVAQTQKVLTTAYQTYVIDYTGTEWNSSSAAFKGEINMWGVLIPSDNPLNAGAVFTIQSITLGAITLGTTSSNVVNDQVTLAPNPAQGSFKVDMTAMQNSETASVKVMNTNGLVVKEITTNNDSELISTEGMTKGIYIVRVTSANKVATKKVVVE